MTVPRVKICGITRVEDGLVASESGADAIGLVFYSASARYISDFGRAREIAQAVGPFTTVTALFVNADRSEIEKVLSTVPINLIQFHGEEECRFCESFGLPYLKAIRVKGKSQLEAELHSYPSAVGIHLDTYIKGKPGGTGEAFNWNWVPKEHSQAIVLAGGLNPLNVREALQTSGAYGVDVSGGVESSPGIKDPELIKKFIRNAKCIEEI